MKLNDFPVTEDIRIIDPQDAIQPDGTYDFDVLLSWIMSSPSLAFELRGHREYVGSAIIGATTTLRKFVNKHASKSYMTTPIKNLYGYDREFTSVIVLLRNAYDWEKDTRIKFKLNRY